MGPPNVPAAYRVRAVFIFRGTGVSHNIHTTSWPFLLSSATTAMPCPDGDFWVSNGNFKEAAGRLWPRPRPLQRWLEGPGSSKRQAFSRRTKAIRRRLHG